ncbi:recQ [Mytilus coruscus]|uniref:DNA 3'-5' helicase n=1 Tax=Mytilus coruscus TaxID=42192 RepID=A0A6J8EYM1_MYTCO|nr:recQ [Mytilus coruscus]
MQKSSKKKEELNWLVNDLRTNCKSTKKTVVYCRNIVSCADLYENICNEIRQGSDLEIRMVAMYQRSTADANKTYLLSKFPCYDTNLRVIFPTIGFGMGVDIPDIERLIHWGAPRGLEQYSQEVEELVETVEYRYLAYIIQVIRFPKFDAKNQYGTSV